MSELRIEAPVFVPGSFCVTEQGSKKRDSDTKNIRHHQQQQPTQQPQSRRCQKQRNGCPSSTLKPRHRGRMRRRKQIQDETQCIHVQIDNQNNLLVQAINDTNREPESTEEKEESFPALAEATVNHSIHKIWTQADHIQTKVAVWDAEEEDEQAAICPSDSEQDLVKMIETLGLVLLQPTSKQKQEQANVIENVDSEPLESPGIQNWCRRPDIAKLRDKWLSSLASTRQQMRNNQVRESKNKRPVDSPCPSESSSSVCDYQMSPLEYVQPKPKESLPPLDPSYHDTEQPLHKAIQNNDEAATRLLLHDEDRLLSLPNSNVSPIQLAVALNRPNILRILFTSQYASSIPDGQDYLPAPHLAVKRGHEECLQLLLSNNANNILSRTTNGNNVLHACCLPRTPVTALQLVLYVLNNSTLLTKAMLSVNQHNETPLHIACRQGLVEHVEIFLSSLGFTLLAKLFQLKDDWEQTPFLAAVASGSTDVVMSLFMWRGNNHVKITSKTIHCPLSWAARSKNVDMVTLLLEFNDPCGYGYDLVGALSAAMEVNDEGNEEAEDEVIICELCRVLVEAGANPCALNSSTGKSSLLMAVERNNTQIVLTLLDTYNLYLERIRSIRRRDHLLQKQPESFFAVMDNRETTERNDALRDALLMALFQGYMASDSDLRKSFKCAFALFRSGAKLDYSELARLKKSLLTKTMQPKFGAPSSAPTDPLYTYEVSHPTLATSTTNEMHWSMVMLHMPWTQSCRSIIDQSTCVFARENFGGRGSFPRPDIVILSNDGKRFSAHSEILSEKCAKFAAAIRFDRMTRSSEGRMEIQVDATSDICLLLLQHVYHGSMITTCIDDPMSTDSFVHKLLDLLVLAEEYICPSLTQECAMRLLSSDIYQCACRSCTKQVYGQQSFYRMSGPSRCINVKTTLDILAVLHHLSDHRANLDCSLTLSWEESSLWGPSTKRAINVEALEAITEAVLRYLLLNFNEVTCSESFQEHCQADSLLETHPHHHHKSMNQRCELLLVCLEEYAASPIGAL